MSKEFQQSLKNGAEKIGIIITPEIINIFTTYYYLLKEENEKYNLTAITEPDVAAEKHFLDSLTLLQVIDNFNNKNLLDIGTGAGFPGLPLKIYQQDIKLTLLDAVGKKVKFLNRVINELNLTGVEAVHGRAEEFAAQNRETYDIVTSRAVAELRVLVEYALPFNKIGGIFVAAKGPDIQEELKGAANAINVLGGAVKAIKNISLPLSGEDRTIVIIEKIKKTPLKYPRRSGIPKKRPL